jgi:hypothetical protein
MTGSITRCSLARRRRRRQVFHEFLEQFVKKLRLIEEYRVRCIFDFFEMRPPDLRRARRLASQFGRFRRCDDQSRTINLLHGSCAVHAEKIRYQHGDADGWRRLQSCRDQSIDRARRLGPGNDRAHHAAQIFFLVRLVNSEHLELRRRLLWARAYAVGAMADPKS